MLEVPPTLEEFIEYIKSGFIKTDIEINLDALLVTIEDNSYIDEVVSLKHITSIESYYIYKKIKVKGTNIVLSKDLKIFNKKEEALGYFNVLNKLT